MPYKSESQRRFFHSDAAKAAGISDRKVAHFDKESAGKFLPEQDPKKKFSPWHKMGKK